LGEGGAEHVFNGGLAVAAGDGEDLTAKPSAGFRSESMEGFQGSGDPQDGSSFFRIRPLLQSNCLAQRHDGDRGSLTQGRFSELASVEVGASEAKEDISRPHSDPGIGENAGT